MHTALGHTGFFCSLIEYVQTKHAWMHLPMKTKQFIPVLGLQEWMFSRTDYFEAMINIIPSSHLKYLLKKCVCVWEREKQNKNREKDEELKDRKWWRRLILKFDSESLVWDRYHLKTKRGHARNTLMQTHTHMPACCSHSGWSLVFPLKRKLKHSSVRPQPRMQLVEALFYSHHSAV